MRILLEQLLNRYCLASSTERTNMRGRDETSIGFIATKSFCPFGRRLLLCKHFSGATQWGHNPKPRISARRRTSPRSTILFSLKPRSRRKSFVRPTNCAGARLGTNCELRSISLALASTMQPFTRRAETKSTPLR